MQKIEKSKGELFSSRIPTKIFSETPSSNSFVAEESRLYGYELTALCQRSSFLENIYLSIVGELPEKYQLDKFSFLLNLGFSVGARYPASRAVMNAGVSKTKIEHLLPIALSVASGTHNGAVEVGLSVDYQLNSDFNTTGQLKKINEMSKEEIMQADGRVAPGFGLVYGDIDLLVANLAEIYRVNYSPGDGFNRAIEIVGSSGGKFGWLLSGLFASISIDLGFNKKQAIGLFQISIAPLMIAFGIEKTSQPLTAMPFVKDKDYTIG